MMASHFNFTRRHGDHNLAAGRILVGFRECFTSNPGHVGCLLRFQNDPLTQRTIHGELI